MAQAPFAAVAASEVEFGYGAAASHAAGLPLSLSIYADRPHVRELMREDVEVAGFHVREVAPVADLLEGDVRPLGDVVLLDCPQVSGAALAALSRLDVRAAHCGAQLIVSTTVGALDSVFACLDQSNPQILVDPSRSERVVALGCVLARMSGRRLRELAEEDRLMLIRLTEQVSQIAERLDRFGAGSPPAGGVLWNGKARDEHASAFRFDPPEAAPAPAADHSAERLTRAVRPPLPDPQLVRKIIRQRQLRARFFDGDLFADPAWDMLLDLTAARVEHVRVSVTSLCIASGVPPTTALRWIGQLCEAGLFQRVEDETDRRRAFITLTDKAVDAMARYFAELGTAAARLV